MDRKKIGRYEILGELGRGAMGAVLRARDPAMGREVALKCILSTALASEQMAEFRERFYREARAAGALAHPGIVPVFDVGEDDGVPFLVMELVQGHTLDARIKRGERYSLERVSEIGEQIADALGYAHRNGVIHRDIKPANILMTSREIYGAERPRITDFGVAKLAGGEATTTGQLLGTPAFMPPEQFTGAPIDGRTDLFALGVIMYRMTTGEQPFPGETLTAVSYKVVHTEPIAPSRLNPAIPRQLEAVILKCLAKSAADRYQTGEELAADLAATRFGPRASGQFATGSKPIAVRPNVSETIDQVASLRPRPGVPNDRSSSLGWQSGVPNDRSSSLGWQSGVPNDRSSSLGWQSGVPNDRSSSLGLHQTSATIPATPTLVSGTRSRTPVPSLSPFVSPASSAATAWTTTPAPASAAARITASTPRAGVPLAPPDAPPRPTASRPSAPMQSAAPVAQPKAAASAVPQSTRTYAAGRHPEASLKPARPTPIDPSMIESSIMSTRSGRAAVAKQAAELAPARKRGGMGIFAWLIFIGLALGGTWFLLQMHVQQSSAVGADPGQPITSGGSPTAPVDFNPKMLDPNSNARLNLDLDTLPSALSVTVQMDGKVYWSGVAGDHDSYDGLMAPPGRHELRVVVSGAGAQKASGNLSGDFVAGKKMTLTVKLYPPNNGAFDPSSDVIITLSKWLFGL